MSQLTPKQEAFAQAYVETGNASEAYRSAYDASNMLPASVNRKAKECLDHVKISARIDILRQKHQERHNVTVDSLTEDAQSMLIIAQETGNVSGGVSALTLIAKLHGLLTEKRELTGKNGKALNSGVMAVPIVGSLDEWERLVTKQQRKLKQEVRD